MRSKDFDTAIDETISIFTQLADLSSYSEKPNLMSYYIGNLPALYEKADKLYKELFQNILEEAIKNDDCRGRILKEVSNRGLKIPIKSFAPPILSLRYLERTLELKTADKEDFVLWKDRYKIFVILTLIITVRKHFNVLTVINTSRPANKTGKLKTPTHCKNALRFKNQPAKFFLYIVGVTPICVLNILIK